MQRKSITRTSYLLILFLIFQTYPFSLYPVAQAQGNFVFVSCVWGSQSNPQKAYPGSSNVILSTSIRNDLGYDLISVSGKIFLPDGVQSLDGKETATATGITQHNGSISYLIKAGEIFSMNFPLDIFDNATSGDYNCTTTLKYTYFDGTAYVNGEDNVTVAFTINSFPTFTFRTVDVYWTTTGGYHINASSGARNLYLNIILQNTGGDSIDAINVELDLGNEFFPSKVTGNANNVGRGTTFTISFAQVSVPVTTAPGTYIRDLHLNCSFVGYGNAVNRSSNTLNVPIEVSETSSPNLQIVRIGWNNFERNYPGAKAITLDVEVQNLGEFTLSDTLVYVKLPNGFKDPYGKNMINATSSTSVGYGDFASISIGPIYISTNVSPGTYYAEATFNCIGSRDSSQLLLSQNFTLPIVVSGISFYLDLATVQWIFSGQPAVAIPGARDVELSITLVNRGEDTLSGLKASVQSPAGFKLIGSNYPTGVIASGSSFTITCDFNISQNVNPGDYNIILGLTFNANPTSGNNIVYSTVYVPIKIEDPDRYNSELTLLNAYWGTEGNLRTAYPGSKYVPLTVEMTNRGIYAIRGAYLKLDADNIFDKVVGQVDLSPNLASGGFSSTTFYVNISPSASFGRYNFTVEGVYFIEAYGAQLKRRQNFTFQIEVLKPPVQAPYIKILSSSWANSYPAYPGTENATFNIAIANQAPYTISGISANLILPEQFREGNLNGLNSYVSGPISPWQTTTFSFSVNIKPDTAPGNYVSTLSVEYTLQSGGNSLRMSEDDKVIVAVNRLGGFEPIYSNWMKFSPGPGNTGAILLILVRNSEVPQMKGVYATVILPRGFKSTQTGINKVNVTPTIYSSTAQVQDIISLLSGQEVSLGQTVPATQIQASKGDVLALNVQVDVDADTSIGNYNLDLEFNFIDQWNNRQRAQAKVAYRLPGSTMTLDIIEGRSKLLIGTRTSTIQLSIRNNGTAPIKDVVIAIGGSPQGISVSSAIKYIPEIGAGGDANLSWLASVNPQTPYTGSLPIVVVIGYSDILGNRRTFNQTAIVYVEGIVDLKLMDTSISPDQLQSGEPLTVSTTLLNLGTYKAKNVEVSLGGTALKNLTSNYAYVGDVDVGSQVPVSITTTLKDVVGEKTIFLVIQYRNVFNEPVTSMFPINITVYQKTTKTKTETVPWLQFEDTYKLVLVAITIAFLAGSGFIIYRMYQKTKHKPMTLTAP
ncbi:MAG: hypothetical protein ACUVQ8_06670 [Nitrososphaeria archaeon]